ncbi:MAG: bifunctional folylpolyglutamate synthase/dihydrofolate synthase [Chloroflexota bacterium]
MNYAEALDFVLSFADYERWPGFGHASRFDLRRMGLLLQRLGSPHLKRQTVHIAGSKGKGSTAAMIASALSDAGFRTGLYTSPHLHTMRERIRIGNELISEHDFADLVSAIKPAVEETHRGQYGELSTFEILTTLGFYYFQEQAAGFQVLETGLGGRLDATNVCQPDVCVITSISLDHTAFLGGTIPEITKEKAGIIKPGVPVVSAPQVPEASEVLRAVCREKGARLITIGEDITWTPKALTASGHPLAIRGQKGEYEVTIPLIGEVQLQNACTAATALEVLDINHEHIVSGLASVRWSGRMEILKKEPVFIVDAAHNGDSARKLTEALRKNFSFDRSILIMGTSGDKDSSSMIKELAPFFDHVITATAHHPRASPSADLAMAFRERGVEAHAMEDISSAVSGALSQAGKHDLICATGSVFLVAEVIEEVRNIQGERYPS